MDVFFQILVNSLITGSVYGVMAMSFSLAYATTRFFNLAHGCMAAMGAYMVFLFHVWLHLPLALSAPLAILAAGLSGFLIDRFIYAPQRRRKASGAVMLVVSLGVMTVIESLISIVFSTDFKTLSSGGDIRAYYIFGASVSKVQLGVVAANIAVFSGLMVLLYKTKFGGMLRAISDDPEVARVLGIRIDIYIGAMFFLAAAAAGLMGVLVGFDTGLTPTMGFYLLLKGIIAAIIGGAVSVPGAFIGGYFLATAENFGIWPLASEWRDAIAFTLLVLFLIFRPQGILGKGAE